MFNRFSDFLFKIPAPGEKPDLKKSLFCRLFITHPVPMDELRYLHYLGFQKLFMLSQIFAVLFTFLYPQVFNTPFLTAQSFCIAYVVTSLLVSLLYVLKASKSGFVKKADVKRKSLSALALVFIFILHAFVFFYSAVNLPKLFFLQIEKENLGGVLAVLVFMYIFLTVYAAMVWNIKNVFLLPVILIIFAIVQETLPSSFSEVLKSQVYLLATLSVFGITLAALTAGIFIQSLLSISVLRKS